MVTVINSMSSPSRYSYGLTTTQDGTLEEQGDGSVFIKNPDGTLAGGTAGPWARDASGESVSTHYEVDGSSLTQVVGLEAPGIAFPVVADPTVSCVLLAGEWKNRTGGYSHKDGVQWSTHLSTWGKGVSYGPIPLASGLGSAVGQATLQSQGWNEWVNGPGSTSTVVEQQCRCHVAFGYAGWAAGPWWDSETARKSHSNWLTEPKNWNWE